MNREDILKALSQLNDAIASLNVRLHPPPADPDVRQELENELAAAQQSQETLEKVLANLPQPTVAPAFAAAAAEQSAQVKAQNDAAIAMSKAVRAHADGLQTMAQAAAAPAPTSGAPAAIKRRAGH